MDLKAYRSIVHGRLHEHERCKEGKHHSRRGCRSRAFVPWDVLVMVAICPGFSNHTGLMAAGFLIQRKPDSTVVCCS